MTQTKTSTAEPEAAESPSSFPLPLDEFCKRLSISVKRPAIIGGFHAFAIQQGMLQASMTDFMSAFESFRSRPA